MNKNKINCEIKKMTSVQESGTVKQCYVSEVAFAAALIMEAINKISY